LTITGGGAPDKENAYPDNTVKLANCLMDNWRNAGWDGWAGWDGAGVGPERSSSESKSKKPGLLSRLGSALKHDLNVDDTVAALLPETRKSKVTDVPLLVPRLHPVPDEDELVDVVDDVRGWTRGMPFSEHGNPFGLATREDYLWLRHEEGVTMFTKDGDGLEPRKRRQRLRSAARTGVHSGGAARREGSELGPGRAAGGPHA
jgi:hypothetical protein